MQILKQGTNPKVLIITLVLTAGMILFGFLDNKIDDKYEPIANSLNQMGLHYHDTLEKLAHSKTGLLLNYDVIVSNLSQINKIINNLEGLESQENDYYLDKNMIISLRKEYDHTKEIIEGLKSDLAVINNSLQYLPQQILELSSNDNIKSNNSLVNNAFLQLHNTLNHKNIYLNPEWYAHTNQNLEILKANGKIDSKERFTHIKSHTDIIYNYRNRITFSFNELQRNDFGQHVSRLKEEYTNTVQANKEDTVLLNNLLKLCVLSLLVIASIFSYKSHKKTLLLNKENIEKEKINKALEKISEFDHSNKQDNFYELCVKSLGEATGHHIAVIALFDSEDRNQLRTQAFLIDGVVQKHVCYSIEGTPCQDTINNDSCIIEDGVAQKYPDDKMLADLGLESYFGYHLVDTQNRPIGLIALMNNEPTKIEKWLLSLIEIFSARISFEVERNNNVAALFEQKELSEITLRSIIDGVIETDKNGKITSINSSALRIFQIEDAQKQQCEYIQDMFLFDNTSSGKGILDPIRTCIDSLKPVLIKEQAVTLISTGNKITIQISAAPIIMADNLMGVVLTTHDISQEIDFRSRLAYQASHDSLSGLYNRQALDMEIESLVNNIAPDARHTLMYIDLDRFKLVNDTCGHAAGDEVIRKVANILSTHVHKDDFVARVGGDEFVVLLKNSPHMNSVDTANKVLKAIEAYHFIKDEHDFTLSASIGCIVIDSTDLSSTEWLSMADMACLSAKKSGRNRIHFSKPDYNQLSLRNDELLWVPKLQNALLYDEFQLYQQPIIDAADTHRSNSQSTDLTHVEILLRLKSNNETIMPGHFIEIAERFEIMPDIDKWVLKNVFARMTGEIEDTSLRAAQEVSINLSGQSLADESTLEYILNLFNQYDLDPTRVCLEVTETSAIANYQNATNLMLELKKLGCKFALDDFGSGLSSYSYIKNLPADYLKIDREFIDNLTSDPINLAIVKSIVDVAKSIDMKCVAEGIEDDQVFSLLQDIGVDYLQGFAIGHPSPVSDQAHTNIIEMSRLYSA